MSDEDEHSKIRKMKEKYVNLRYKIKLIWDNMCLYEVQEYVKYKISYA